MPLDKTQQAAMLYAQKPAQNSGDLAQADVIALRIAGSDDDCIHGINQVCSYFCYANRRVLGPGCSTKVDVIGLSPGNNDDLTTGGIVRACPCQPCIQFKITCATSRGF